MVTTGEYGMNLYNHVLKPYLVVTVKPGNMRQQDFWIPQSLLIQHHRTDFFIFCMRFFRYVFMAAVPPISLFGIVILVYVHFVCVAGTIWHSRYCIAHVNHHGIVGIVVHSAILNYM